MNNIGEVEGGSHGWDMDNTIYPRQLVVQVNPRGDTLLKENIFPKVLRGK
jgi:hypothetical protein